MIDRKLDNSKKNSKIMIVIFENDFILFLIELRKREYFYFM